MCAVCGEKAAEVDHITAIANGGSFDGAIRSLCVRCHRRKTVADSHESARRAAADRRRT
jgi:5-methylcytosine-specific restriction endonuclease McrA